jgi:hypothetical protein
MVFRKKLAYHMVVAALAVAPFAGCDSEAPAPPPEVKKAEEEAGTTPPTVDLGTPKDSSGEATDSSTEDGSADGE